MGLRSESPTVMGALGWESCGRTFLVARVGGYYCSSRWRDDSNGQTE